MPRPANGCRSTPHRRRGVQWRPTRYTQWLDYALQVLYIFLLGWFLIHRPFWKKRGNVMHYLSPWPTRWACPLQLAVNGSHFWHPGALSVQTFGSHFPLRVWKSSHICIFLYFLGILLLRLQLPRVQDVQAFEAASNQSAGVLSRWWLISSHRWEANTLIQCPTTRCALFYHFEHIFTYFSCHGMRRAFGLSCW